MTGKKPSDRIGTLIADVEGLAKRLRAGIRRRAAALPKDLKVTAARLRKQAAHAAVAVERYAHDVGIELQSSPRKRTKVRAGGRKRR